LLKHKKRRNIYKSIFENEKLKINKIIKTQNKKILIFENEKLIKTLKLLKNK
jgi:hypothetical protein